VAGRNLEVLGRRPAAGKMCGAGRSWEFGSVVVLAEVWAVMWEVVNSAVGLEEG